jgi:hypothetical protein
MANGSSSSWDFTKPENIQIRTTLKVVFGAVLVCFFLYKLHDNLVSAIDRNGSGRWDQLDEFHGDQVRKQNHPEYPALELEQIKKIADMNEDL